MLVGAFSTGWQVEGNKMGVPKRKKSKSKIRSRKGSQRKKSTTVKTCPNCGAPQESHRACPACGYYKSRQVISVEVD
ncbi:50S ribosomal protein L32 [Verrucomicrobiota bacterium]